MCNQERQQIIEQINIDIDRFLKELKEIPATLGFNELDKKIICQSLLGFTRQEISKRENESSQNIGDRLSKSIYPRIAQLMPVEQEEIAGNWGRIINFLLNQNNGYRLNPPPQLNDDNFQGSLGRQFFLYPPNQDIVRAQLEGTKFYQQGRYYQAFHCFLSAWNQERDNYKTGNPEVLIYLNNCLIDAQQSILESRGVTVYTFAIIVPFYHNQGCVAAEILRGIAQIQHQVNSASFNQIDRDLTLSLNKISSNIFLSLNNTKSKIALKFLIVNDPNNLYSPSNQTAERLAKLASEFNIIAILGHYSSEMTKKALPFYAEQGLVLANFSSTSNELSKLSVGEKLSFFRLTTQDGIAATQLADYLTNYSSNTSRNQVAIIYNTNSSYSRSYREVIREYIEQHQDQLTLLSEWGYISENYYQIQAYLEQIRQEGVDIIIIIPDGGIEPNSLNNSGLISRLNLNHCLIAGSATFYHENVLHWLHEQSQYGLIERDNCNIITCIPWHWHSKENGCNSPNYLAQNFCQMGTQLWGEENLTWRSATAFDSVLIIFRILEQYKSENSQSLLEQMDQYYKQEQREIKGVTGTIRFAPNGDRINPPTEIVRVGWNEQNQQWKWTI